MPEHTLESMTEIFDLADQLLFGRSKMFAPQDLPGRYGRVVRAIDNLLQVLHVESVLAGGWAVWWHGYEGRLTQDVDIVLAGDAVADFLRAASVAGFELLPQKPGRWPKLLHKETNIKVDILPEGMRPGTVSKPAPTTIRHPAQMGATGSALRYITLPALLELKIAAGRDRDQADVVALLRANPKQVDTIRAHLEAIHEDYVKEFDRLFLRSREEDER